jgi:multidrug transporter EmrE-like cation transporter
MTALDVALYLASALLTAAGLTWIKLQLAVNGLPEAPLVWAAAVQLAAGAGVYLAGMVLWLAVLGRNQMSIAYPIGIGLSLVATTLAAMLVLGEPVGVLRLLGVAAILAGAACISRSA